MHNGQKKFAPTCDKIFQVAWQLSMYDPKN